MTDNTMTNTDVPVLVPTQDEIKQLTFVDFKTHIQVPLPNVLIITSCKKGRNGFITYYTESSVRTCIQTGITEAKRRGYTSENPQFIMNYPTVYDPVKKTRTPKGLVFVWFADPAFPNIFRGLNPDGSNRVEQYPDPTWVAPPVDDWEEEAEEEIVYTSWESFKSVSTISWADMAEEEDKAEARKEARKKLLEPPMLTRNLPPITTLMVKQGAEDPEVLTIESGFSKIKKEVQEECDLSLLHASIPAWADISDLMKSFAPFSTSSSYPILEVIQNRDSSKFHLYVSYAPGSDCAIIANMILFRLNYKKGKNEETIQVDFAKKGSYERFVEKLHNSKVLKLTPCMNRPPRSTIPSCYFGSQSTSTPPKHTEREVRTPSNIPDGNWRTPNTSPQNESPQKATTSPQKTSEWNTMGNKKKKTPCKTPPKGKAPPKPTDGDDDGLSDLIAWSHRK